MWNMPQNTSVRATNKTSQTLNLEIKNQKFNFVDILRKWKRNGENILSKLSTSMKSKLDSEIGTVQKKKKNFFLSSATKFSTRWHIQSKFTYVLQHTLNQELVKLCLHKNLQDVGIWIR